VLLLLLLLLLLLPLLLLPPPQKLANHLTALPTLSISQRHRSKQGYLLPTVANL
jgi:hypothetical protein